MFCLVDGAQVDGFGKVVAIKGNAGVVEYFDSPAHSIRYRVTVPLASIRTKRLGRNTRVFVFNEVSNKWAIGRVREDSGKGVEVRLSNKRDLDLPYERVFVRWKRPIADPVDFLGILVTETPMYAEARSGFMRSYIAQRGATFGISALLSSSIELEPHQIDVVRRVLTDHTQRYLLADEVGLGKTIEAGIIIRQTVLDDMRGHRVLVLVPRELLGQWREELTLRFGLSDFLDDSVLILAQEDSAELRDAVGKCSLLVIDEAHHVTASKGGRKALVLYELVKEMALKAERLLLLSATPILRNEDGFLRMLNLLDPVVYPLNDLEGFRSKVVNRQVLAETVAALDPANALFMDSVLDELLERLPDDPRLSELVLSLKEQLVELPDESNEDFCVSVRQLRAHISETYRLNRRILRNRRTQIEGLTPERKGAELWWVNSSSMDRLESALEDWRVSAELAMTDLALEVTSELSDFYWTAVCSLPEGPDALSRICSERQKRIRSTASVPFSGEEDLLDAILRLADGDAWMDCRSERLYQGLGALSDGTKAVVFCISEQSADFVFGYLKDRRVQVIRHGVGDNEESSGAGSWRDFLDSPDIRVIVCGQKAEEGINLQGGKKVIVHFDLPLQPNRVEQRMGRVDRYGAGNAVPSFVLVDKQSPLQLAWYRILHEGLGVFNRSISSLQYLVEEEVGALARLLIHQGVDGLDTLCDRLSGPSGEVTRELRLIDQQDALDQLSPVPEQELDDLFDADSDWREFSKAMNYWIEATLLFDKVKAPRVRGALTVDDPFRFHYCPPDAGAGQPTLIPLSEFLEDFLGAIDYEAPGNRSTRPQSYLYVAHRPTAVKGRVRPFRYGTEFIESIRSFSEVDVRGRSYAMWRQFPHEFQPGQLRLCFRFDFLIETRLDEALDVLSKARKSSKALMISSLTRRGDALFRPTVMQVWLDEEGDELPTEFVDRYLAPSYAKAGGEGYIDKNVDGAYLTAFKRWSPDTFVNWTERCERMRDMAKAVTTSKAELLDRQKESLARAIAEDEIRYAQLRTRIQSLDGREAAAESEQLALEVKLNEALHRGISSPTIKVDVAGVVFLTSEPVSLLEGYMKETE